LTAQALVRGSGERDAETGAGHQLERRQKEGLLPEVAQVVGLASTSAPPTATAVPAAITAVSGCGRMPGTVPGSRPGRGRIGQVAGSFAEEWRPGGEMRLGDDPATARLFAAPLARLVDLVADIEVGGQEPGAVEPPLPNPEWTRWDHDEPGVWPRIPYLDGHDESRVPEFVVEAGERLRDRLSGIYLPRVLGHADWESQNIRWHGDTLWAVHDWDSLAWLPEAAIAGAAAGAFASHAEPTLAPIASSAAFLEAYQAARRPFTAEEIEVAWAASLWLALHNARAEALRGSKPIALNAVASQALDRLRLAGA